MWLKMWTQLYRNLKHNPVTHLSSCFVLIGCFTVILSFVVILINFDQILMRWGDGAQMSVYLKEEATEKQISKISTFIRNTDSTSTVEFVTKAKALEGFKSEMEELVPGFLDEAERVNPFPNSIESKLGFDVVDKAQFKEFMDMVSSIKEMAGVEDISYGQSWLTHYKSVVKSFSFSSWGMVVFLMFASLLIVGNSIKSSIAQRKDEIEVLELVGASLSMIRAPFLFEGLVFGIGAATISTAICYLLFTWEKHLLTTQLGFLGIGSGMEFISMGQIILFVIFGGTVGVIGAYVCVTRIATGWSAAGATK